MLVLLWFVGMIRHVGTAPDPLHYVEPFVLTDRGGEAKTTV